MRRLLPVVLLALLLAACDTAPAPTGPPATATAVVPAGPTGTPTAVPSPSATPVPTSTPIPTNTPVPTPTEGAVRTPVGGAAGPEFMAALAAMDAAPTYRYTVRLELGPVATRFVLTGTGAYAAPASYDTNFDALGFNTEILVISNTTYVRSYGRWQQGPPGPTLYPMGAPPAIPSVVGLATYAIDAALVGDGNEQIDGQPVRHYHFLLRAGSLLGPAPGLGTAGGDLWTEAATHRFRRLVLSFGNSGAPGDNDGRLQMDFQDYGAAIVLTPPPVP